MAPLFQETVPNEEEQMANIYDNIDQKFTDGLIGIIENSGVERADFCAGYFNLRGWDLIMNQIDKLRGGQILEVDEGGRESW